MNPINKESNLMFVRVITIINVIVASGYSVVGLVKPSLIMPENSIISDSTLIFAMYAAARTIPLALLAIWAAIKRSRQELVLLGILAGTVQFLDGFVGLYQHDPGKAIGPFVLATLQFSALAMLSKK